MFYTKKKQFTAGTLVSKHLGFFETWIAAKISPQLQNCKTEKSFSGSKLKLLRFHTHFIQIIFKLYTDYIIYRLFTDYNYFFKQKIFTDHIQMFWRLYTGFIL